MALRKRGGPQPVQLLVLVAGIGTAVLFCAFLLKDSLMGKSSSVVPATPTPAGFLEVLVPIESIEVGTELTPRLFRKESREQRLLEGANVISNFDQLRGAYAKSFIPTGQPLVADQVTSKAPINSVVPKIRPGFRAITVVLDKQTTNEGWARAGVRVDVLLISGLGPQSTASIIAQNLRILSSGTSVSPEFGGEAKSIPTGESTVTLEVSVEDQKRLKLASGQGQLRLLLRGDEDTTDLEPIEPLPLQNVLGLPNDQGKTGPADQGWVIIDGRKYRVVGASLLPE